MTLPDLADRAIVLRARAHDWRAAVRLAGEALVDSGCTTAEYTEAMIRMVDDHGPTSSSRPDSPSRTPAPAPTCVATDSRS